MNAAARGVAVAEAMADIRTLDAAGVDRDCVEGIRDRLLQLASQRELFPATDFPPPTDGSKSCMYRVAQDEDDRFTLYVQVVADVTAAPPHDHTTWAVIVGFEGQELNKRYGGTAGGAEPRVVSEFMVEQGTGIGFLPDEVHSIHIEGGSMNFHCYGLALEELDSRRYWDDKAGDWKIFPPMSAIVEARV